MWLSCDESICVPGSGHLFTKYVFARRSRSITVARAGKPDTPPEPLAPPVPAPAAAPAPPDPPPVPAVAIVPASPPPPVAPAAPPEELPPPQAAIDASASAANTPWIRTGNAITRRCPDPDEPSVFMPLTRREHRR